MSPVLRSFALHNAIVILSVLFGSCSARKVPSCAASLAGWPVVYRWQRYICSPAPYDAPYYTLLLVNKAAAPTATSSAFEEVHFDNSCMGE
jgi:hypothetical protein